MVDSQRIAVRPVPGEVEVYRGATWAKSPSEQVQDTVLHALEDSGKVAVARQGSGIAAAYRLEMDLRRYEADYAGGAVPAATVEIYSKLLRSRAQPVAASRTFVQTVPAGATDVASVAQAFSQALGAISGQIAGWTLVTGQAQPPMPQPER